MSNESRPTQGKESRNGGAEVKSKLVLGSWLVVLSCVVLASGCGAGQRRHLHPITGNEFTLFPGDNKAPPPITCTGDDPERFGCFARELELASKKFDVGGALAVSTSEGRVYTFVRSDALNEVEKINAKTRFPAASLTKMFLAATAVALSLDGRLDLHVPIAQYLLELENDEGVGRATLHQLLTHTSGLGSPEQCETPRDDVADVVKKHGYKPLLAPPGAVFNYSNVGYTFVAAVIERVTDRPFEEVVKERVLVPVGLPDARFGPDQVTVKAAHPEGEQLPANCRAMWPSGGLALSIRELIRWTGELSNPETSKLGKELIELITAPHVKLDEGVGSAYGYGIGRREKDGAIVFSHAGRLPNFSAFVGWSPERKVSAAAFANRGEMWVVAAGFRALSTFLPASADWQPPRGPLHPLDAYAGTYEDNAGTLGRLKVSIEGDVLAIDYLDGPPPLLPATFRFVFEPGTKRARYVVTPVGVGERNE